MRQKIDEVEQQMRIAVLEAQRKLTEQLVWLVREIREAVSGPSPTEANRSAVSEAVAEEDS